MADSLERIAEDLLAQLRAGPQDTGWSSSYADGASLIKDVERFAAMIGTGGREAVGEFRLLFAATGVLQETAMASGWVDEYLRLAARFDAVV